MNEVPRIPVLHKAHSIGVSSLIRWLLFLTLLPALILGGIIAAPHVFTEARAQSASGAFSETQIYLTAGQPNLRISQPTALRLLPGQTLQPIQISLDATGRLTTIPAALANHLQLVLPEPPAGLSYVYEFLPATSVVQVAWAGDAADPDDPLVHLPVNAQGKTPILKLQDAVYRLQVDPNTLGITEHTTDPLVLPEPNPLMPHQWYVANTARTVHVTGHSALRVLPGQSYTDLEIHLEDDQTRLVEVASALTQQARFHLPEADYAYAFDQSVGQVTIRREGQTAAVLSLPVDQQGETAQIRVGSGDWTRIAVDPDTLALVHTVTTTAGMGGSINPSSVTVTHGATVIFTIVPEEGNEISSISGCRGALLDDKFYIIGFVQESCTVNVIFSDETFAIEPSVSPGGSVLPSSQIVPSGTSVEFEIVPDDGFFIKNVFGCEGSLDGNTFRTSNITKLCEISIQFTSWEPFTKVFSYDSRIDSTSISLLDEKPNRVYMNSSGNSFPLIVDYDLNDIIYQGDDIYNLFSPQPGGTNRVISFSGLFGGVPRFSESLDGGFTWNDFESNLLFTSSNDSSPKYNSSGTTLLAITSNSLKISTDNGRTFFNVFPFGYGVILPSPIEENVIILRSEFGLQRSLDSGLSWNEVEPNVDFRFYNNTDLVYDRTLAGALLGTTIVHEPVDPFTSIARQVILWSTDYGDTWEQRSFPSSVFGLTDQELASSWGSSVVRLCSAGSNPTTFYLYFTSSFFNGRSSGLFMSADQGISWNKIDEKINIGLPTFGELYCGYDENKNRNVLYIGSGDIYRYLH